MNVNKKTPLELSLNNYLLIIDTLYFLYQDSIYQITALSKSISINKEFTDLSQLIIYPNPFKYHQYPVKRIVFQNLPEQITLYIFNSHGEVVKTIQANNTNGMLAWQLDNNKGKKVATGLYFYYIMDSNQNKKKGKLAIIR